MSYTIKEQVNYTVKDDVYYGYLVDAPSCMTSASSLEELEIRLRVMLESFLHIMREALENDFNFKTMTPDEYNQSYK